mmetsp:Transcript_14144/g.43260  ORF Transcript_14144/g.43260 Transcript_14144/m.43260 type:complete len:238 (-) Transcript_14144:4056-4769(-)
MPSSRPSTRTSSTGSLIKSINSLWAPKRPLHYPMSAFSTSSALRISCTTHSSNYASTSPTKSSSSSSSRRFSRKRRLSMSLKVFHGRKWNTKTILRASSYSKNLQMAFFVFLTPSARRRTLPRSRCAKKSTSFMLRAASSPQRGCSACVTRRASSFGTTREMWPTTPPLSSPRLRSRMRFPSSRRTTILSKRTGLSSSPALACPCSTRSFSPRWRPPARQGKRRRPSRQLASASSAT